MNESIQSTPKALRALETALNFVIMAYGAAIALYLVTGPVDLTLSNFIPQAPAARVMIGGAGKPMLVLILAVACRLALVELALRKRGAPRPGLGEAMEMARQEMGPPILALTAGVAIYILTISVYRPWSVAIAEMWDLQVHDRALAEAMGTLPKDAVVYATSGAYFNLIKKMPGARILTGVGPALQEAGDAKPYFVVDTRLSQSRKWAEALDLSLAPDYRLSFLKSGVYVFSPGAKGPEDMKTYIREYLTFTAQTTDSQVGSPSPDPSEPGGFVRKGATGKDQPGFLVYGPYISLMKGTHEAVFRLKVDKKTDQPVAELDVAAYHGATILAKKQILGSDFFREGQWQEFRFEFKTGDGRVDTAQLRVIYLGGADLYFSRLWAEPDPETWGK